MAKILLVLFLFCSISAFGQDRIVRGTMLDDEGSPIPGVNILIKGTTTGTVTNIDGNYSIKVPLGSVLVFTYIGFTAQEMKVTESNSLPLDYKITPQQIPNRKNTYQSLPDSGYYQGRGIARMREDAPPFVLKTGRELNFLNLKATPKIPVAYSIKYINPFWAKIRYGESGQNGVFVIQDHKTTRNYTINFTSSFTIDAINKLPKLQNQYAQGRPRDGVEQFQGPETGELFSWGPKVTNLEYNEIPYPFDKNGILVPKGAGSGMPAQAYNPYGFFRKGSTFDNNIKISQITTSSQLQLAFHRRYQQSIIPNAGLYRNDLQFRYSKDNNRPFNYKFLLAYTNGGGTLLGRGANLTNMMSSVYRTPPTFDNSNGIDNKSSQSTERYELSNGNPRNYSPGQSDNPYGLVATMPDEEKIKSFISNLNLQYDINRFNIGYTIGVESQRNFVVHGLPENSAGAPLGRWTDRVEKSNTLNSILQPSYQVSLNDFFLKLNAAYHLKLEERMLDREDHFNTRTQSLSIIRARRIQELKAQGLVRFKDIAQISLSNGSYYSNTTSREKLFLPAIGASFKFIDLFYSGIINDGKIHATYAESVKEAPLIYNDWAHNSTIMHGAQYQSYFESSELFHDRRLSLENLYKFETGFNLGLLNNTISIEVNYFNNLTKNAIVPVFEAGNFMLKNVADIANKGMETGIGFSVYRSIVWQTKLHFTHFTPVVQRLNDSRERIALAGFFNTSTSLVEGQPVGIIYGTRYLRNEMGQVIIGEQGFPLVDPVPGPIGNPNPDWIGGVSNSFSVRGFSFSFVIDVRKGGKIWNGTQNALNFYGASKTTQDQRNIRDFIFEGVKEDGTPNDQTVDFANPSLIIDQNRWVRYGLSGIDEEAIEDGSWIRLNEVKLTYSLPYYFLRSIKMQNASISLLGRNLLLLTRYSGVDPATNLFGYNAGMGLDFFNAPNTRSYGMSLNIKI